jgi:hypothetical protein
LNFFIKIIALNPSLPSINHIKSFYKDVFGIFFLKNSPYFEETLQKNSHKVSNGHHHHRHNEPTPTSAP